MKHQKNIKIYNNADDLENAISKSNLIKMILTTITGILALIWLLFIILGVISYGKELVQVDIKPNIGDFTIKQIDGIDTFWIIGKEDINPLFIADNTLALLTLIFTPLGYLGIIFLISLKYGVLTPIKVKSINRQALALGYLKQENMDYILKEIDINIGIKERDKNEK